MRHPAENFIKYIIIRHGAGVSDAVVERELSRYGFLPPAEGTYLGFLRQELDPPPDGFDFGNKLHRPSMQYLRDNQVYELFFRNAAVEEAFENLSHPYRRTVVEQALLSRLDLKLAARKLNAKNGWFLTTEGLKAHRHFFWNVSFLTFDEWGRYLYGRSSMYANYMTMLRAPPELALFHLRVGAQIESKMMITRAQEIAYHTLEEVAIQPGADAAKVKAIGVLTKSLTDCHAALTTSDMALETVLKQFERFRMEHTEKAAVKIHELAPAGNFSGSGVDAGKKKNEDGGLN